MSQYVFFIDIDGTLVDHESLPRENVEAIVLARAAGHKVFINTGRSVDFIPKWLLPKLELDGLLAGSGAYIRIGEREILNRYVDDETVKKTARFLCGMKKQVIFEGRNHVIAMNPLSELPYPIVSSGEELLEKYPDIQVQKVNIRGRMSVAGIRFLSMFYDVIQQDHYVECSIPGTSKGSSLERVMEDYPGYTSVAIGDSANDLQMLVCAEIAVAMGNAPDSVKHVCTDETTSVLEGGVAKAILSIMEKGEIC